MNKYELNEAVEFLRERLELISNGSYPKEQRVLTGILAELCKLPIPKN